MSELHQLKAWDLGAPSHTRKATLSRTHLLQSISRLGPTPKLRHRYIHWVRSWCRACVAGKGRSDKHVSSGNSATPVIGIDYGYLERREECHGEAVSKASAGEARAYPESRATVPKAKKKGRS